MTAPAAIAGARAVGGFSLIELAIVLTLIGILLGGVFGVASDYLAAENREITAARLEAIEEALVLYASRNKRLPCPADGTAAEGTAADGVPDPSGETETCSAGDEFSVVPWRALGMEPEATRDGFGRRITYRVFDGADGLTDTDGMDMSACEAAAEESGSPEPECTAGISPVDFLRDKGLTVDDPDGNAIVDPGSPEAGGGAAFVLVSHGNDGAGAYTRGGTRIALAPAGQADQRENTDMDDTFVLGGLNAAEGTNAYFDDIVTAPTIHEIASRAGLGPQ
ncbi:MAG: type II secretion system protein [Azospirillaceae bacterium]